MKSLSLFSFNLCLISSLNLVSNPSMQVISPDKQIEPYNSFFIASSKFFIDLINPSTTPKEEFGFKL